MVNKLHVEAEVLQGFRCVFIAELSGVLFTCQHEILSEHFAPFIDAVLQGCGRVNGLQIHNEALLDTEYRIRLFIWIAADIYSATHILVFFNILAEDKAAAQRT